MKKNTLLTILLGLSIFIMAVPAWAGVKPTIIFIPHDDRPVSFMQTVDTINSLSDTYDVVIPPAELLGNRTAPGKSDELWKWLNNNARGADAAVLSSDSLLYGSLVASRKHDLPLETVVKRAENFKQLQQDFPSLQVYVFGSIMRSPRSSAGGEEPGYYAQYGADIFQLTSLWDKAESNGLDGKEKRQLKALEKSVPKAAVDDWMTRRSKNYQANEYLIELAKQGAFRYLLLGKDDNAPYSQTHKESRLLSDKGSSLGITRFQALAGIDELGMLLLARVNNDLQWKIPMVHVKYADGKGAATVPSYSDEPISKSISSHLAAAGAIEVSRPQRADLVLFVNTKSDGRTSEANFADNTAALHDNTASFVKELNQTMRDGYAAAVADIAYANGADNALMAELKNRQLLSNITAYAGWNTATNSTGFAIGQGLMAEQMTGKAKNKLLLVRYLDDWAYQANVRQSVAGELGKSIKGGDYSSLNKARPAVTQLAQQQLTEFAGKNLKEFKANDEQIAVDFPWNRMFETAVKVAEPEKENITKK